MHLQKNVKKSLFAKSLPWKAGAGLSVVVTNEMRHFLFLQRKFLLKSSQKNGTYCNSKSRPLRKGDTHKSRSVHNFFKPPKHSFCKLCFGDGIQNKAPRSSVCAQTFVLSISQQGGGQKHKFQARLAFLCATPFFKICTCMEVS